ncbi:hypothetical protein MIN45_P0848 [Methylomarinovum tepidoasis]|uniref:Uncharacterized protein n=1 Tax=Methylomarinovum tepidoasis TaxID=2840183 RepID=A0AAU9D0I0_9GAMM|nr:hypothetical protein [Methylomarinovum sp. IN45]BCX88479.1 hypothetical protein MIN45_P0848 [Methylomarinovum sp. IN45]
MLPAWVNQYPPLLAELEEAVDLLRKRDRFFPGPGRGAILNQDTKDMLALVAQMKAKLARVLEENSIIAFLEITTRPISQDAKETCEWLREHDELLAEAYKAGRNLYLMQACLMGFENALLGLQAHTKPQRKRPGKYLECFVIHHILRACDCHLIEDKVRRQALVDFVFGKAGVEPPSERTYRRWVRHQAKVRRQIMEMRTKIPPKFIDF